MQEELEKEGIWDFNRLIKPYVRRYMLQVWLILHFPFILVVVCVLFASIFIAYGKHVQERFGERWSEVAQTFFIEFEDVRYEVYFYSFSFLFSVMQISYLLACSMILSSSFC